MKTKYTSSSSEVTHRLRKFSGVVEHFIFLIGPGGVGKTTTGPHLAALLSVPFVDLDDYFCTNVLNIRAFISKYGYEEYVRQNSRCFREIASNSKDEAVVTLSSGFLIIEEAAEVVTANREMVRRLGRTVLLIPSHDQEIAADEVARRQVERGFGLREENERRKFVERLPVYQKLAQYVEISNGDPAEIACRIAQQLRGKMDMT
ncbi:shikimate kinase [Pseudovibrio sp. Tun.PSC04-5.I4]|uniref:shikimate kinase n=1 Tax=Pseudovibrio sp. Tun.PSC04-5.I4 TaxID=1798213 RepID=UPI00088224F3|nr:shikimate kinase [Pseudovibrio sp. Tun.PSC04-5.I4]SDQ29301.1 shikimate kinase [Pseudovibrio sp. Tun.PSC04-5.I4]